MPQAVLDYPAIALSKWSIYANLRIVCARSSIWTEHLTTDQKVGGSNPFERAIFLRTQSKSKFLERYELKSV
jgi:hypothetical protein